LLPYAQLAAREERMATVGISPGEVGAASPEAKEASRRRFVDAQRSYQARVLYLAVKTN
jgi:hypothetical protein